MDKNQSHNGEFFNWEEFQKELLKHRKKNMVDKKDEDIIYIISGNEGSGMSCSNFQIYEKIKNATIKK